MNLLVCEYNVQSINSLIFALIRISEDLAHKMSKLDLISDICSEIVQYTTEHYAGFYSCRIEKLHKCSEKLKSLDRRLSLTCDIKNSKLVERVELTTIIGMGGVLTTMELSLIPFIGLFIAVSVGIGAITSTVGSQLPSNQ